MDKLNLPKKRFFQNAAPFWKRALAYLIDLLIINVVIIDRFKSHFSVFIDQDFNQIYQYIMDNPNLITKIMIIEFIIALLMIAYFVIFELYFGQTPGKMIMRLFVKHKDKKNKKKDLELKQVLIRAIFKIPASVFTLLFLGDLMHYIIKRERLGDVLANTKVIEVIAA